MPAGRVELFAAGSAGGAVAGATAGAGGGAGACRAHGGDAVRQRARRGDAREGGRRPAVGHAAAAGGGDYCSIKPLTVEHLMELGLTEGEALLIIIDCANGGS